MKGPIDLRANWSYKLFPTHTLPTWLTFELLPTASTYVSEFSQLRYLCSLSEATIHFSHICDSSRSIHLGLTREGRGRRWLWHVNNPYMVTNNLNCLGQDGCEPANDAFKSIEDKTKWPPFSRRHFQCIFFIENGLISIKISLQFVPKGAIINIPALVQIMAWRRPGDKPLSEPMIINLLTHLSVTRPHWVKCISLNKSMSVLIKYKIRLQ